MGRTADVLAKSTDGSDRHNAKPLKKRAVIRKTQHERILSISANTSYDVPLAALNAYKTGRGTQWRTSYAGCHLSAGRGRGDRSGRVRPRPVRRCVRARQRDDAPDRLGPQLNGRGPVAAIHDTDNGSYDGDKVWDRAVGPMQFIPCTWSGLGVDGDGDGKRNPTTSTTPRVAPGATSARGGGDVSSLARRAERHPLQPLRRVRRPGPPSPTPTTAA